MTAQPPNGTQQGNSTQTPPNGGIYVPPPVFAQLEALRESGVVNMYTEVHAGLEHFGFEEAREWLESNPELYVEGFTKGFAPTNPDAVEEIDSDALRESVPDEPPSPTRADASTPNEQYLLDNLQGLRRFSERAEEYYSHGTWRETAPLTDEELELADLFDVAADCEPQMCYRNALLTAATFGESYDVTYVEGYVKTSSFASSIEHAWVELRGKVVELTFPEGPQPETDAAYLGVEFPVEDVKAKIFREGIAEPLVD
ncbi:hypothetical protein [Haloprofundus halobius]|uniref:hypothetical protein n=1 Tax=Haloprofundus halobius TaxID=2876194 RepID=UPI001CCC12BE|nr:hypothetical protein [Haloprofundus halobius]